MGRHFSLSIIISLFIIFLVSLPAAAQEMVVDSDQDSLSDYEENFIYHTNPFSTDTDGDGFNDAQEVRNNFSPLIGGLKRMSEVDTDNDGLNDELELQFRTGITTLDSDGDGETDFAEVYNGYDPLSADPNRALQRSTVVRHVEVNLSAQTLDYFLNNVKLGTIPVSTGKTWTPTPLGDFYIQRKLPVHRYVGEGYDIPGVKWNLQFKPGYYLHGAFWHNQFGIRPMSHGCVNIAYKDVEKLYLFLDVGDLVTIYGKTPAGRIVKK
jgi:hypothetical protein